jgi:hypothetical protein
MRRLLEMLDIDRRIPICSLAMAVVLTGCGWESSHGPLAISKRGADVLPENEGLGARAQACQRVATLYNGCGQKFSFDGNSFRFPHSGRVQVIPCDDGQRLGFYDRLEMMDVSSIFMFPYLAGATPLPERRRNWDPGRLRQEDLLKSVFGATEAEVRSNLVNVSFLNQTIRFQKNLGAAAALARVGLELASAMASDASLARFMEPYTSKRIDLRYYAFSWRNVAGTTRLSTHSFGTAIDLLQESGPQYWLWDERIANPDRAKQGERAYRDVHYIPSEAPYFHPVAVEIFERNGFIWGGKWNHYDTMHFEYRPELLASARVQCPSWASEVSSDMSSDQESDGEPDAWRGHEH